MSNSEGKRKWAKGDKEWRPIAYEKRLRRATYAKVEMLRGRWENPWRWSILNRAATNFQRILITGEEPDAETAMAAAEKEYAARTFRDQIAQQAKDRNQAEQS